ncbi:signal peptidase I SipW [Oceanobacillus sp. HCA-5259]|uniref:signal peptidase I SipW n=1 Tax=Oceanobacillus sp. HCA-5259 TaxID=3134661 RepID=UPI00404095EA
MLKRKKWYKYLNFMVSMLLTAVLILTMVLVVNSKMSEGNSTILGYQINSVLSGSMEPGIKTGSIIFVKTGGDTTRFQEGDIVTFLTEEEVLVTHRIEEVGSEGQTYITKGDANDGVDREPVLAENIIGEYTGVTVPYAGYVVSFANTKEGAALLLILPGLLLMLYAFITIWQTVRMLDKTRKETLTDPKVTD